MPIEPVGAVAVQQAQTNAQHAAPLDGDGDHDRSPSAGSPQGSTTSTYA
jgi:hypothetical protein